MSGEDVLRTYRSRFQIEFYKECASRQIIATLLRKQISAALYGKGSADETKTLAEAIA